jgi:hypothetical protein
VTKLKLKIKIMQTILKNCIVQMTQAITLIRFGCRWWGSKEQKGIGVSR